MRTISLTNWFGRLSATVLGKASAGQVKLAEATAFRGHLAVTPSGGPLDEHEFFGSHLLASYVGCDELALADHQGLMNALREAIRASGATLVSEVTHEFSPSGMTALALLSESHASIHTYPEHRACFVDLFTCGRSCSAERFDASLREHLRPREAHHRIVLRHGGGTQDASPAKCDSWPAEWAA